MAPDPITLGALTRALDARPVVLEQAWEAQLIRVNWIEAHRNEANSWPGAVVISGIATA